MPLSFLVPAVLVGLLAIGIPVLIHLTRKQKAKVVPGDSVANHVAAFEWCVCPS